MVWKKGFDQSKVTENNYISLAQFEYAVFFEENYEEEIASGDPLPLNKTIIRHEHSIYVKDSMRIVNRTTSMPRPVLR